MSKKRNSRNCKAATTTDIIISLFLFVSVLVFVAWLNIDQYQIEKRVFLIFGQLPKNWFLRPLKNTCPAGNPATYKDFDGLPGTTCPSYFRWIHEDLQPWKETGITKEMLEQSRKNAHVRVVVVKGKAYVERYKIIPTRDMSSMWGILQLLRRYPDRLPDLDFMFNYLHLPLIRSKDFQDHPGAHPPPLFGYCSNETSFDIPFPDWTFWGSEEQNIRPWRNYLKEIIEASERIEWKDRLPYAYWRGQTRKPRERQVIVRNCSVSRDNYWNVHAYSQDWKQEVKQGFKHSNLKDQCTHRYKIYADGTAWSVSKKYILACDSMALYLKPGFFEFFGRGLRPLKHYWPIRHDDINALCPSLKFAVEWGNTHPEKAKAIGEAASNFIQEELKMDFVYDYMFHLLSGYAKLLRFKPEVPVGAIELCEDAFVPPEGENWKEYMAEGSETPSDTAPCAMPPPYDAAELRDIVARNDKARRKVELLENEYWENCKKQ